MTLKNKTVLVTGGTKGIGKAIVEMMAQEGANVVVNYSHDERAASSLMKEIKNNNIKVMILKADITKENEVSDMFEAIKKEFGSLDVLVNNAGIFDESDSPDNTEVFERIFKMNFLAQVRVTNETRKIMKKGKIIFVSSIHGKLGHGGPTAIAYSSMKAALDSYMKNLAKAVAPNILINAIAPGRTLTPMWGEMDEVYKKQQAAGHLIKRWIRPDEIADGVVFLAKNDAVCGEVLVVDGGMSLKVINDEEEEKAQF